MAIKAESARVLAMQTLIQGVIENEDPLKVQLPAQKWAKIRNFQLQPTPNALIKAFGKLTPSILKSHTILVEKKDADVGTIYASQSVRPLLFNTSPAEGRDAHDSLKDAFKKLSEEAVKQHYLAEGKQLAFDKRVDEIFDRHTTLRLKHAEELFGILQRSLEEVPIGGFPKCLALANAIQFRNNLPRNLLGTQTLKEMPRDDFSKRTGVLATALQSREDLPKHLRSTQKWAGKLPE